MVTLAKQRCHEVGNDLASHVNVAEFPTENLWGFATGVGEDVVEIPRIAVCQGVHFHLVGLSLHYCLNFTLLLKPTIVSSTQTFWAGKKCD